MSKGHFQILSEDIFLTPFILIHIIPGQTLPANSVTHSSLNLKCTESSLIFLVQTVTECDIGYGLSERAVVHADNCVHSVSLKPSVIQVTVPISVPLTLHFCHFCHCVSVCSARDPTKLHSFSFYWLKLGRAHFPVRADHRKELL